MPFQNASFLDRVRLVVLLPVAVVMQVYRLLVYVYDTSRLTGNPAAMLVYLGAIKEMNLKLKNGKSFRLTKGNFHHLIGMAANSSFKADGRFRIYAENGYNVVAFGANRVKTVGGIRPIMVEFSKGVHSRVNVNGREVVDIGSYMGETALYFVIKGHARKVYTFEPVKSLYTAAVENIKLNRLDSRIKAYNLAIVGKSAVRSGNSFSIDGSKVSTATLDSICKKLGISNGVLKMDVEGAEYGIINGASGETLRRFSLMHIEYHYGYADLVKRLRDEGFEVRHTRPEPNIVGLFSGVKYMGDIIAKRKQ